MEKDLLLIWVFSWLLSGCQGSNSNEPPSASRAQRFESEKDHGDADAEVELGGSDDSADAFSGQPAHQSTNNGLQANLVFSGPFAVGDGTLEGAFSEDGYERRECFSKVAAPRNQQTDRVFKMVFHVEGEIGQLKLHFGKVCGASASYYGAEVRLYKNDQMLADLGRLGSSNSAAMISAVDVPVVLPDGMDTLETGDYAVVVVAEEANSVQVDKSGPYEDMAFSEVEVRMLSGNATLTAKGVIVSSVP
jgi:hypothetical protein